MSTNTFDRELCITDWESYKRLLDVVLDEDYEPLPEPKYTYEDIKEGEELFKQCLSRYRQSLNKEQEKK